MNPSDTPRRKPIYKRLGDELAGATILEVDSQLELYRQEKKNHRGWDNERDRDAPFTHQRRGALAEHLWPTQLTEGEIRLDGDTGQRAKSAALPQEPSPHRPPLGRLLRAGLPVQDRGSANCNLN